MLLLKKKKKRLEAIAKKEMLNLVKLIQTCLMWKKRKMLAFDFVQFLDTNPHTNDTQLISKSANATD